MVGYKMIILKVKKIDDSVSTSLMRVLESKTLPKEDKIGTCQAIVSMLLLMSPSFKVKNENN
jgi:hypothetical protein